MEETKSKILIHADPGARSHFVAEWLQDNLAEAGFDVGATIGPKTFFKIHRLEDPAVIKQFSGTRIRIRSTYNRLGLQLLLFLRKNVHSLEPNFTKNEYSLETFSKVYIFAKEIFADDLLLDYSLYDHVITFADTLDIDKLVDLYRQVNHRMPSNKHINRAVELNRLNQLELDPNHACAIAAMISETESRLGLLEENRLWSIPVLYNTTPVEDLHRSILESITQKTTKNLDLMLYNCYNIHILLSKGIKKHSF